MFDHEVVGEGTDDPTDVRHDPRDPEEVIGRAKSLPAESCDEREEPAERQIENLRHF